MKKIALFMVIVLIMTMIAGSLTSVFAEDGDGEAVLLSTEETAAVEEDSKENEDNTKGTKAIAAAIVVAVAAAAGAVGMAVAISKSAEGMSRQPEAAGKINSAMMLGLVFIETAIIYALIVAILIIFVL